MKLLVVDREDAYLPKGWISGVLKDHQDFSEYETKCGLWRIIENVWESDLRPQTSNLMPFIDGASLKSLPPSSVRGEGKWLVGGRVKRDDELSEEDQKRGPERVMFEGVRPFPHAELAKLDRSHSTIWPYGPGQSFSTPQSAFDALVSQEAGSYFSETHYIRGYAGEYNLGPYSAVLALHTVRPNRWSNHPLVIDRNGSDSVVFNAEGGGNAVILGELSGAAEEIDYVRIYDLELANGVHGVSIAAGDSYHRQWTLQRLTVRDCSGVGLRLNRGYYPAVKDCLVYGGAIAAGVDNASSSVLISPYFTGCALSGSQAALHFDYQAYHSDPVVSLISNTLRASGEAGSAACVYINSGSVSLLLKTVQNNVFSAPASDVYYSVGQWIDGLLYNLSYSDNNCYHYGRRFATASDRNIADLAEWRSDLQSDMNCDYDDRSLEADPLLSDPDNGDFALGASSPCRGAGASLVPLGLEGNPRGFPHFDIGAYNPSAHQYIAGPRIENVITRRNG